MRKLKALPTAMFARIWQDEAVSKFDEMSKNACPIDNFFL